MSDEKMPTGLVLMQPSIAKLVEQFGDELYDIRIPNEGIPENEDLTDEQIRIIEDAMRVPHE